MIPGQSTYLDSLRGTLSALMEHDPDVILLGEDITDPYGGAFKVTKGLSSAFPDRVIDTPICEATIVGAAVGLAIRGMRPVVEIMFGDFMTLATDQIVNHAAKMHGMYNGGVNVSLVIRTPMGGRRGYGPTHSQSLESMFLGVPHIKVVAPSHFHDAGAMLRTAIYDPDPVIFIESKTLYPVKLMTSARSSGIERSESYGGSPYPTILVRNYEAGVKPDVTIISYGCLSCILSPLLYELEQEEIYILVCLPGCLSPLVEDPVLESARASGRVILVEEGPTPFGWSAEIATHIYASLHNQLRCPIVRLGAEPTIIPASKPLEDEVLVSKDKIMSAVLQVMQ